MKTYSTKSNLAAGRSKNKKHTYRCVSGRFFCLERIVSGYKTTLLRGAASAKNKHVDELVVGFLP